MGLPGGLDGKESTCNVGDLSLIPGLGISPGGGQGIHLQCGRPEFDPWVGKIPWRRERLPTPVFWPEELHGLCSPWGCKESEMTE